MDHLIRDLRYALRTLAKSPLFTAVAVLTLALGIGVNTTIFTFVNAVLLAPPPIAAPEEVMAVYSSFEEETWATSSYPDYLDLREQQDVFSGLCGTSMALSSLQHEGTSEFLVGELVTGEYFEVLGVDILRGRPLVRADDDRGAPRTVVLSDRLWRDRFAAVDGILGQAVRLSGESYEVVGVAPPSFTGLMPGLVSDFWAPAVRVGEIEAAGQIHSVSGDPGATLLERRGYRWLWLRGRLAEGQAANAVEPRIATVMARLEDEHPVTNDGVTARAKSLEEIRLHPEIDGVLGSAATVLMVAVGLVLLVVCANLANLLLARAERRRREIAVRLALGASRGRLVRQLVTEGFVLSVAGAAVAVLLAQWTTRLLLAFQPPIPFSIHVDMGVDGRVVGFAALLALGSAVAFALVPAFRASRPEVVPALKDGASSGREALRFFSLRNALVIAQVAVSTVLLIAAALLLRAVDTARQIDVGFDPARVATVSTELGLHGYSDEEAKTFFRTFKERAVALPGVESVALARRVPFDINMFEQAIYPDILELDAEHSGFNLDATWIDPDYFATLGVPVVAGRGFTTADAADAPLVAIVNQAMARRFWAEAGAVGERFRLGRLDGRSFEIVGVVADAKVRTVGEAPRPLVHYARAQRPSTGSYLLARSAGPSAAGLLPELRRLAFELDPQIALAESATLEEKMAVSLFPVEMGAMLLGLFALLALVLASVGLYGVIAMAVSRRAREIGIRVALGARPREITARVIGGGMVLVLVGAVLGAGVVALVGSKLSGVLYGTSAHDPLAYVAALLALAAVALLAHVAPALRATRLDVVTVLKEE